MEEAILEVVREQQGDDGEITLRPVELVDLISKAFPHLKPTPGGVAHLVRIMARDGKLKLTYAEGGIDGVMTMRVP